MDNKEEFSFTYSAQQQKEVEEIRKKYLPKEEDKMEQLRRLHAIPTQKAQAASLAVGVIGALILGTGMSVCLTDIGAALGSLAMVIGILVGVVGMVLVALAYPLYNRVLQKNRDKIAPEILRLSDELLQ
jgi:F0F1-type ATP synthase assembly protein I